MGQVFAIVGPSGAGKDTLIDGLLAQRPDIHRARRTITRPNDGTEELESVTPDHFAALLAEGAFALHWQAHGLSYGIRHSEFLADTVIFNGSRKALAQSANRFPNLQTILVTVSPKILGARLAARGREDATEIEARLKRAKLDLPEGIAPIEVHNDGTPQEGIRALVAAIEHHSVPAS